MMDMQGTICTLQHAGFVLVIGAARPAPTPVTEALAAAVVALADALGSIV